MNTPATSSGGHTGRPLAVQEDAAQMPLNQMLSGGAATSAPAPGEIPGAETDFSFVDAAAAPRKRSLGGVGIVLLVVGIGAAALYGMRLSSGADKPDPKAAAAEKKIDLALAKLTGKKAPADGEKLADVLRDTDQIIAMFSSDPAARQVDVEHVQRNPFQMYAAGSGPVKTVSNPATDAAREARLRKLRAELETLKLQSILSGNAGSGLAVISGKVVREGESVGSFVVTSVTPAAVLLTADGNTYTLSMPKPTEGAPGPVMPRKHR